MQYVEVVITLMTFTCAIIITSKIVECSAENGPQHLECRSHTGTVQTLQCYKSTGFDFVKSDGEGCERELLTLNKFLTRAIVKSHSSKFTYALIRQLGASVLVGLSSRCWTFPETKLECSELTAKISYAHVTPLLLLPV